MQRLEVSGAVRSIYGSLGIKRLKNCSDNSPPSRKVYLDAVVGLAWSNDPKSWAGGNLVTGTVSHARQVKGDDPDEMGNDPSS